jgi:hypothetical protein
MPFAPGQSGNPGGRPKGEAKVRDAAQALTDEAIGVLADALKDDDRRIAIKAAEILLDRGWGKPAQSVDVANKGGEAFVTKVVREIVHVRGE